VGELMRLWAMRERDMQIPRLVFEREATLVNRIGEFPYLEFWEEPSMDVMTLGGCLVQALDIDKYTKYTKLGKIRITIEPVEE